MHTPGRQRPRTRAVRRSGTSENRPRVRQVEAQRSAFSWKNSTPRGARAHSRDQEALAPPTRPAGCRPGETLGLW